MGQIFAGLARVLSSTDLPVQVAAVCYRQGHSSVEFLLVKASSGKWTFPKGRLNPGMTASESAAREAWEEAGAQGRIARTHFGSYLDTKRALEHDRRSGEVHILAYLLEVHRTQTPEEDGRKPSWFLPHEARKALAAGRSRRYSRRINKIIDAAIERLEVRNTKRAGVLLRAQGRRRLAIAR
ncbi:MAG TPA: NUDIX domain-containing protein [Candidatus Angelobacter sp.]